MAVTLAQTAVTSFGAIWASDGIEALSFAGEAAAGSLIVVGVRVADGITISGIDDDGTTSYSEIETAESAIVSVNLRLWAGIAAGTGAGENVTVTTSGASATTFGFMGILNFAGTTNDLTSLPQNNTIHTDATQNHAAGEVTPDETHNVLVGLAGGGNGTYTMDANYTDVLSNSRIAFGYRIQSSASASTYTPTSSETENSGSLAVAFRGTADGGATVVPVLVVKQRQNAAL